MEIKIDASKYVSESRKRKKKGGNARSQMLRMIMPHLSRETGDKLAKAIDDKNTHLFKAMWDKVKNEIAAKLAESKSSSEEEEFITQEQLDQAFKVLSESMEEKSV